ncbi:MAG: ribonuclease Y [Atribacterota bacterium]|nr:ribonuclease Y [Atribacterota bacterium]
MKAINTSIFSIATILFGILIGFLLTNFFAKTKLSSSEKTCNQIIENAKKEAESIKKEAHLQAKEESYQIIRKSENECQQKRNKLENINEQLIKKSNNLVQKLELIEKKQKDIVFKEQEVDNKAQEINKIYQKQRDELARISKLDIEEAKQDLLGKLEKELDHEAGKLIKSIEEQAKEEGEKKARNIIALSIQRYSSDYTVESTISVVSLPNEDMKGRIIGREGRNIRTFERIAGVDLIVDDTPEAVIISGFDPVRREIARIALEKLITDGRIQPARIEEVIENSKKIVESSIKEEGEKAVFDTNVRNVNPKLINILGKLKYRTSYGQNVLQHSKEVAYFSGIMADELGLNANFCKRAGLLHDIGKAADMEIEGPHALIGADIARKNGESPNIINAIASHHEDEKPETVEAILVQAADAISASRPGARREMLETYIKRLSQLEEIANSFEGVEKCYAIQAGREIRIIVNPEEIDDYLSAKLSRDISKKIEKNIDYPGQVKVNVIRETRSVEYAK